MIEPVELGSGVGVGSTVGVSVVNGESVGVDVGEGFSVEISVGKGVSVTVSLFVGATVGVDNVSVAVLSSSSQAIMLEQISKTNNTNMTAGFFIFSSA